MTIVIILLVIAILLGIAGSIILILGLNQKKNILLISGGIMLLFTVLFCAGAILCSACHVNRCHKPDRAMMPPAFMPMCPFINMPMHKCDEHMPMMDGPKEHPYDSVCTKKK